MNLLPNKLKRSKIGIIALIVLTFIFASMGTFARYLGTDFSPIEQTFLRIFFATLFGLIAFGNTITPQKIGLAKKQDFAIVFLRGVLMYGIAVPMYSYAVIHISLTNVTIISSIPISAILGVLFLNEKPTPIKTFLLILSVIGAITISLDGTFDISKFSLADSLLLFASLCFSLTYILRRFQSDFLSDAQTTILMLLSGIITLFIVLMLFGEGFEFLTKITFPIIIVASAAGLFNIANVFLMNFGFQRVEAFVASLLLQLELVFAFLFGLLYGEFPQKYEIIGGIIIVGSVISISYIESKQLKERT